MNSEAKSRSLDRVTIGRGLLAGVLAWLIPGAGHLYVGARQRALVFFLIVAATLSMGLLSDGNLAVVDNLRAPVLSKLQVVSNLAIGPVEPLIRSVIYGEIVYVNSDPGGKSLSPALEMRKERSFRRYSLYGSVYLLIAGLMNMLLIFDAWDIAIGRKE